MVSSSKSVEIVRHSVIGEGVLVLCGGRSERDRFISSELDDSLIVDFSEILWDSDGVFVVPDHVVPRMRDEIFRKKIQFEETSSEKKIPTNLVLKGVDSLPIEGLVKFADYIDELLENPEMNTVCIWLSCSENPLWSELALDGLEIGVEKLEDG